MTMLKTVLAVSLLAVTSAGTAWADNCGPGVDCKPYGVGGLEYDVAASGFETPLAGYGQTTPAGYVLPGREELRGGCFAISPSVLVGHADGFGEVIPDIHGRWEGTIYPNDPEEAGIVNIRVEVLRGGAITTTWDTFTTAWLLSKRLIYNQPDGGKIYLGDFNNTPALVSPYLLSFPVKENDEVRVKVCDLVGGSSLTVHSLVIRTIPFDN